MAPPTQKSLPLVIGLVVLAIVAVGLSSLPRGGPATELVLTPQPAHPAVAIPKPAQTDVEVGTGWGRGTPEEAARQAIEMAQKGKTAKTPQFVIVYPTAGSDCARVHAEVRRLAGPAAKIYGGTLDIRGVMTDRGYIEGSPIDTPVTPAMPNVVAVMTITSPRISFGVGAAVRSDYPSAQAMAAAAAEKAIRDAGHDPKEKPAVMLCTIGLGLEEDAIAGIGEAMGKDVVLLGGSAADPNGVGIGNDGVYEKGICLAALYTDLPVGWVYQTGFDTTDEHSGIVTKVDGQIILEIDNQPALDVYDRWLGGEVTRMRDQGTSWHKVKDLLTLNPFYRKRVAPDGRTYTIFSHPWPVNKTLVGRAMHTSTNIAVGERIYLSYGTWELLLNRVSGLPLQARQAARLSERAPVCLGMATICASIVGVVPEAQRKMFPVLIDQSNGNAPVIAWFTWGEQGPLRGIGNQHCNVTTSFLVIGTDKQE